MGQLPPAASSICPPQLLQGFLVPGSSAVPKGRTRGWWGTGSSCCLPPVVGTASRGGSLAGLRSIPMMDEWGLSCQRSGLSRGGALPAAASPFLSVFGLCLLRLFPLPSLSAPPGSCGSPGQERLQLGAGCWGCQRCPRGRGVQSTQLLLPPAPCCCGCSPRAEAGRGWHQQLWGLWHRRVWGSLRAAPTGSCVPGRCQACPSSWGLCWEAMGRGGWARGEGISPGSVGWLRPPSTHTPALHSSGTLPPQPVPRWWLRSPCARLGSLPASRAHTSLVPAPCPARVGGDGWEGGL